MRIMREKNVMIAAASIGLVAAMVAVSTPASPWAVNSRQSSSRSAASSRNTNAADGAGRTPGQRAISSSVNIGSVPSVGALQVVQLTSGAASVQNASQVKTSPVHPRPGGTVVLWVADLVNGNSGPAPAPTVSGAGLSFLLVNSQAKHPDAPRRLSTFVATVPPHPGAGPLTIGFGRTLSGSEWLWGVVQSGGRIVVQQNGNANGGFEASHSVTYRRQTRPGDAAIAGFIIGQPVQPVAGHGMKAVAQATGQTPGATIFVEWTNLPTRTAGCTWSQPGHAIGIAVEIGL